MEAGFVATKGGRNPKLVPNIPIFGNLVHFDLNLNRHQMGRNKRRKHRNLNGLHEEIITPLPGRLDRLPPPTTPIQDMKFLVGERTVSSLLSSRTERIRFL
jgi:hypothetical protein